MRSSSHAMGWRVSLASSKNGSQFNNVLSNNAAPTSSESTGSRNSSRRCTTTHRQRFKQSPRLLRNCSKMCGKRNHCGSCMCRFVRHTAHAGATAFPVPARFVAAHAINVAQVVARIVPYDYEWAGRQIAPVVAALLMDCGMLAVTPELLAKPESLSIDERRSDRDARQVRGGSFALAVPELCRPACSRDYHSS